MRDLMPGWCPYGQPGDLLWVRETWQLHTRPIDLGKVVYRSSENASQSEFHELIPVEKMGDLKPRPFQEGWRSSIHMPRWASRLTLELTGVRVERLQEISGDDCVAEGIEEVIDYDPEGGKFSDYVTMRDDYKILWESINGAGSWEANPWVWVLEFRVHQQNIDAILKQRKAARERLQRSSSTEASQAATSSGG